MTITSNNLLILNSILKEYAKSKSEDLNASELFELFSCEQILKDYSLSDNDLNEGIIDGGDDGGIDAIYLFINGQLCTEEFLEEENIKNFKTNNTKLSLYILQAKNSDSFKETVMKFILSTMKDFLDLSYEMSSQVYKNELIEKRELFKKIFLELAPYHPLVEINISYSSKGFLDDVNEKIHNTMSQIKTDIMNTGIPQSANVNLYGAAGLIELNRILPQYKLPLKFQSIMNLKDSYILLVKIKDYYDFLINNKNNNKIRDYLFEANIRDHQGNVAVNKEIKDTLESSQELDINFWWLNNGITVLASDATIAAGTINLDQIQIVNGLQTSYSIFESYQKMTAENKEKELLVRVILTSEDNFKADRIIKATNSQTPLPPYSLRATEQIHRDIEDYLKSKNLYYDRRKNYYKNIGKNAEQIISIQYMAQVINAILLKKPQVSRSAPGSLVKNDEIYSKIFGYKNIEVYAKAVLFMKKVLTIIKNYHSDEYKRHEKLDFQYHIGLKVLENILGNDYDEHDLLNLDLINIDENVVINALKVIIDTARKKAIETESTILAIAKSKDFTDAISIL